MPTSTEPLTHDPRTWSRVIAVVLVLIFLSLLLIGNEMRYQGCVGRIDANRAISAAHPAAGAVPPECSRLPFGA